MTTEEKLQHFQASALEDARQQSRQMLDDYTKALEKELEEHKQDKIRQAKLQIEMQTADLERNKNKELSREQLHIKRKLTKQQTALTDKLFVEIGDMLTNFTSTHEYNDMLIRQIREAKDFAKEDEIIIYIDPSDTSRLAGLEMATGVGLTISQYSFLGGTRAVIPSKNILIDNSFQTKLAEAKEAFTWR